MKTVSPLIPSIHYFFVKKIPIHHFYVIYSYVEEISLTRRGSRARLIDSTTLLLQPSGDTAETEETGSFLLTTRMHGDETPAFSHLKQTSVTATKRVRKITYLLVNNSQLQKQAGDDLRYQLLSTTA